MELIITGPRLFAVFRLTKPVLNSVNVMASVEAKRSISSVDITKNLTLLSSRKPNKIVHLQVQNEEKKPLVVMLSWLMAKKKHMTKFAHFYVDKGFDVLHISITPWQLLWPVKGTQIVAADILKFLENNTSYSQLLVHGFSVGGYVWSEALVQMQAKGNHQHITDRIIGQIWDSAADLTEIPNGLSFAVFPENKVLQGALKSYVIYHLKAFDKVATTHYIRASQIFHTNIVKAPALFLFSKIDPIGTAKSNLRAIETWENMGIQTYMKCWDQSPHVGHYRKHPDEYTTELTKFLETIGTFESNQQQGSARYMKAKL